MLWSKEGSLFLEELIDWRLDLRPVDPRNPPGRQPVYRFWYWGTIKVH